jgi:hypothetical protein
MKISKAFHFDSASSRPYVVDVRHATLQQLQQDPTCQERFSRPECGPVGHIVIRLPDIAPIIRRYAHDLILPVPLLPSSR